MHLHPICVGLDKNGELLWGSTIAGLSALSLGHYGFTLVELLIVIAIMSILAAIAIPNFARAITQSQEAMTKGNLGTIRSALSIYYADTEGMLPTDDLTSLMIGSKYLRVIPTKYTPPFHPSGNSVSAAPTFIDVRGDWFYFSGGPGVPQWGDVLVNCVHADLRGNVWSAY